MDTGSGSQGGTESQGLMWTAIGALGSRSIGRRERDAPPTIGRQRLSFPRLAVAAMVLGGVLWILYGPLTMSRPWGVDVVYRDAKGYSVIVDTSSFLAYSLPGSLALVLTGTGLLGLVAYFRPPSNGIGRAVRGLTYLAVGLGLISLAGVAILLDPISTAGRIFGTLTLAAAAIVASVVAHRRDAGRTWVVALVLLGAIGAFLFPLWPLVYALGWLTEELGAFFIALFGSGWLLVGYGLWRVADGAPVGDTTSS